MIFGIALRYCTALSLMVLACCKAAAQDSSRQQSYLNSIAALQQRLGDDISDQTTIGVADPEIRLHLNRIEELIAQFNTPEFAVNGMQTFESLCTPLNQISVRYILNGGNALSQSLPASEGTSVQTGQLTDKIALLMRNNGQRFQDELAILSPSAMRCIHAHLPFITAFVADLPSEQLTPVRISGIQQTRRGLLQLVVGVLTISRETDIKLENKQKYFDAIAQTINGYTKIMPLATRTEIRAYLQSLPPAKEASIIANEKIVDAALGSIECTGLCLIEG